MLVTITVDVPSQTFSAEYTEITTLQEFYDYLAMLGFAYPKYKLYWREHELKNRSAKLSSFLNPDGDNLNLNDPPFLTGLLIGGLAAGAIGYSAGRNAGRKQQYELDTHSRQY